MRDFRKDGSRGSLTDSGNGGQQVAPALEVGMIVEVLANLALDLRNLFIEGGDDLSNRGCDNGCLGGLCVDRLLSPRRLEMLVVAHKRLQHTDFRWWRKPSLRILAPAKPRDQCRVDLIGLGA